MEAIRVGDLLVGLMCHTLEQVLDLVELLRGSPLSTVGVLQCHEDEN